MLSGLSNHKKDLPEDINDKISEAFYEEALETLERRKRNLDQREQEYKEAAEKFLQEYEAVRRSWKRDSGRIRRSLAREEDKLSSFGLYFVKG